MATQLTVQNLCPAIKNRPITPKNARTFVGIDFGTSNSAISISFLDPVKGVAAQPVWIKQLNSDGIGKMAADKIPTVIAWHRNRLMVGKGAADLKYSKKRGVDVWYSFKMELGEDLGPNYCNSVLGSSHPVATILRPIDAAKIFFQYLKKEIEQYIQIHKMPERIEYAVSIPASFEANQRKDLLGALEAVGINVGNQSLIDEPNAAFLSYVAETNSDETAEKLIVPADYPLHVMVFDFGAGTCDISILEIGTDENGIYSKNLSISRFEKLGGDDIDRLIALQVLFKQLLLENNVSENDFKSPQINKGILPKLMKPAEELKIQICKNVALQYTQGKTLPPVAFDDKEIAINRPVEIDLPGKHLVLKRPALSYAQFNEIMDVFLKKQKTLSRYEGQEDFVSIFNPIESALGKCNIEIEEIDHVLLIGGSSNNPYIQCALHNYFEDSKILIPQDLQTHVSAGAAIHSLIFHGFGRNIINAITSEPIMVLTKGGSIRTLIPAGTQIPSEIYETDNLMTQTGGQKKIELPVCVTSEEKILHVATIENNDGKEFTADTPIKIRCQITADKLLLIEAIIKGIVHRIDPLNPLANKPLDYHERKIYEAQKKANINAERNGGKPDKTSLIRLAEAYAAAQNHLRAAETLETCNELYPGSAMPSTIADHYSRAGKKEKSLVYREKEYTSKRSPRTAFNLAVTLGPNDPRYPILMEEAIRLDPYYPYALHYYGAYLQHQPEGKTRGLNQIKTARDIFKEQFDNGALDDNDYHRLIHCANLLNDEKTRREVEDRMPKQNNRPYNEENLLQSEYTTSVTRRREPL